MAQLHIVVDLPEDVDPALKDELAAKGKTEVVLRLFEAGKISSGYGARMLDVTRRQFLDLLHDRKIAMVSYAEGELEQEIQSARRLGDDVLDSRNARQ